MPDNKQKGNFYESETKRFYSWEDLRKFYAEKIKRDKKSGRRETI
jgi:hypothetical protein|tara:strand:+ start:91 stop:225 length:135 start_codon:yes stop_codon:yes gene_type:complete